jgi:hypothetical protein
MNASQLLEVAMKGFVSQDQEAKWKANRKMKKKVDLLAAAVVEWSGKPQQAGPGRGKGNHRGQQPVPLGRPCPREELGQDQCAYYHQDGQWKNECPQWARDSQKTPKTMGRG